MPHRLSQRAASRLLAARPTAFATQLLLIATAAAAPAAVLAQAAAPTTENSLPAVRVSGKAEADYAASNSKTATKTDTPLLNTPQSITVVSGAEMRDRAVQSVAEAARYVPGVGFAQGEGNRETPIFRGISATGDFFIDGVRDDVQYYRDLYNIDRVEIFKGPNAMIFGRGATGGLINRVSKVPEGSPFVSGSLTLGSFGNRRVTADINQPVSSDVAFRLNAMHENSDSYRDGVWVKRTGINPTLAWRLAPRTQVTVGYEHFKDDRIADRGIASYRGAPVATDVSTFFGNAEGSPTWTKLNAVSALVEHEFAPGVSLRNRTRWSDQDKFYQNVFPGSVTGTNGNTVSISAYNNATQRKSIFNQTDLTVDVVAGGIKHKLLAGAEFGKQDTSNLRLTGYFPGDLLTDSVPLSNPISTKPVTYKAAANDASNTGTAKVAALYVQDQVELSKSFQLIAGLRVDRFEVDFLNNRNGQRVQSDDDLVSPRVGAIFKPFDAMSIYANFSIAYQPRAGEQLSSLSLTTASLKPEKFKNYELGAKWDILPRLAATAAVFRLDRSNVSVPVNPNDPTNTATMLVDGQRTQGVELGLSGNLTPAWSVAGGYAYTDAEFLASSSSTLVAGAAVGQVPKHTLTLWNRYDFSRTWGAGLGVIHRTKMFASNQLLPTNAAPTPNVELPGYTRADAAVFFTLNSNVQMQLNVENLFDKKYFANAHSNTNLMPGSPRAYRFTVNASF